MRLPRWSPRPFELFALAAVGTIVLFLLLRGVDLDRSTVRYVVDSVLYRMPAVIGMGVALRLLGCLVHRRSPAVWLRGFFTGPSLLLFLRTWVALTAMTYGYFWLKVSVPLVRRALFDQPLWAVDRALHFGFSPTLFATAFATSTGIAPYVDVWYMLWLTTILAVQSYVLLGVDAARRRNFTLACLALWLPGAWIYVSLPALGPCYFAPDLFAEIRALIPNAAHLQGQLWENYLRVLARREGGGATFQPFLAIAAMPSLHVGAHAMFAFWARRHQPRLFLPFVVATFLTFFGSVMTGWHYAIDGYVGIVLGWIAVVVADRLEPTAAEVRAPLPDTASLLQTEPAAAPGSRTRS